MNLSIIYRKLLKNKQYFIINIIGLSLALSSIILIFSFVKNELSYDKFHSKADRIYRLTYNTNTGISSMIDARFFTGYFQGIRENTTGIEYITGLSSFKKAIVTINDNAFYSEKVFQTDSSFFKVFDFELITGDKNSIFNEPKQAAITESIAKIYFGTTDVIGKKIKIMHQQYRNANEYIIKGILADFPKNSHFKADILCSPETSNTYSSWAYSYALLAPNIDYKKVQKQIQDYWDIDNKDYDARPLINLQALTDIHLKSHKTRELETNGNLTLLILLISGVLIILTVALINFINMNYVQFLTEQKIIDIKIVNGATNFIIIKDFLKEIIVLLIFTITISLIFTTYIFNNYFFNIPSSIVETLIIILAFSTGVLLFALLPYVFRKKKTVAVNKRKSTFYKVSLVIQLLLSITAITSTLFIQKQINYSDELHPQSENADIIVIPRNSKVATEKFEILKEQLLKYPEIIAACAVSEEPAGTVVDNFPYTYNGDTTGFDKTLNALIVDNDFFSFMNIKAIAGTVDMGEIPTYEWERKALELGFSETSGQKVSRELKDEIVSYSEKYVINKTALKHLGIANPEDAIGKEFRINHQLKYLFPKGKIIGVVNDFHYNNIHEKDKPLAIMPRKLFCHNYMFRINPNNKNGAISIIEKKWKEINVGVPFNYEFITDSYKKVYKNEFMQMQMMFLFSIISIVLSIIGMYAMISYKLKLKTKEIGIRKVNGATIFEIIKMLNKEFIIQVLIAFIVAVPIAYYAMSKWLENFAYKTNLSWWVFALAGLFALLITFLTVSWQTLKIARKNPVDALRYE